MYYSRVRANFLSAILLCNKTQMLKRHKTQTKFPDISIKHEGNTKKQVPLYIFSSPYTLAPYKFTVLS